MQERRKKNYGNQMKLKRHVTYRRRHEGLEKEKCNEKEKGDGREYDNKLVADQQNRNREILKA